MSDTYTLYENVRIRTLDDAQHTARAMLVHRGYVYSLYEEPHPHISGFGNIRRIDCQNLIMLPAFTDSHIHLMELAIQLGTVDVSKARSEDEAVRILKDASKDILPGEWVQGSRWGHNMWNPSSLPSKENLDAAFPHNPVFLPSRCGHLIWANALAMKAAGITSETPDPAGGRIERNPQTGEPTGILKENAVDIIWRAVPAIPAHQKKELLWKAACHLHRFGILNIHTPDSAETFSLLQEMRTESPLHINVLMYLPHSSLDTLIGTKIKSGFGDDVLRFGGIKLFVDGSLGGRTAWMFEPFEGEPHNTGIPVIAIDALLEAVRRANNAGICTMTHAIGDRAVDTILNVYADVNNSLEPHLLQILQNRVEHFQLLSEGVLKKMKEARVVASMQPVHIFSDWAAANRFWGKRSKYAYAFRTIHNAGLPLVFGSDGPVEPVNPFWGMYAAVERRDLEGNPAGGWYPAERISAMEALRAYCSEPPTIVGEQDTKGTLSPGKRADFVLTDYDPIVESPDIWKNAHIYAAALAGKFVYTEI